MKKTEEMIQESTIWAGLNKPGISIQDADIIVFGIPYDGGVSFRNGAKDAPAALRGITYTIAPTTEYFEDISQLRILDIGDFDAPTREVLFDLPIIGFDVVEIALKLDTSLTSLFAGRKIITECWGHYLRKTMKLNHDES